MMNLKRSIIEFWHKIPEKERKEHISNIEKILNYLVNASLLSVPTYFFSLLFLKSSFIRFILILISLWILLPFIEYYYVWFKDDWKYSQGKD